MAVALLIGLWVYDQCSYDRFTPGYRQAYQVKYNFNNNGEIQTQSDIAIPLAAAIKNNVPGDRLYRPRLWPPLMATKRISFR